MQLVLLDAMILSQELLIPADMTVARMNEEAQITAMNTTSNSTTSGTLKGTLMKK